MDFELVARAVLNLLAPVSCAGCQKPDVSICRRCRSILDGPAKLATPVVSRALSGVPVISGGAYLGIRRALVIRMKEGGRWRLAKALATTELVSRTREVLSQHPGACVVPVPPSQRGLWKRGYAPTAVFAQALVRGVPGVRITRAVTPVLRRELRRTVLHPGIPRRSREQRLGRRSDGYLVQGLPPGAQIILVDDVMATGATVDAVAQALTERGHRVLLVVVATHVPQRARAPIPSIANRGYSEGITLTRRT